MRVLELTAHVQAISRERKPKPGPDGVMQPPRKRSATAAAAYRACTVIACEREGRVHDYRRKAGLEASAIVLPDAAPDWMRDRSRLWNAAELRERNGPRGANPGAWKAHATVAREVMFGLPDELSPAGRLALAQAVARHLVATHGVAVDFNLHLPGKLGDQRNHHCHMLFTTRRAGSDGLADKTREWDDRLTGSRTVAAFRATLAGLMNAALAAEGHGGAVHVEHRSFKARGIKKAPGVHLGLARTNATRKRQARERAAWERQERDGQAARHGQERTDQARDLAARAEARGRDIDGREARAIEAAPPAPPPEAVRPQPGRLRRLFQTVTGHSERAPELPAPARADPARTAELRASFQAERDRMAGDHGRDRQALAERHHAEDRQLDRAAASRVTRDRTAEVMERRSIAEARQHERGHGHQRESHERERGREPG